MIARRLAALLLPLLATAPALATAQAPAQAPAAEDTATATPDPIEAIDAEFDRKFRDLERERLAQLAELAGRSEGPQAARVQETYFRSALGAGLFQEAEPTAHAVLEQGAPSAVVRYLAEVVNIMAEADRGAFEESLQSIVRAVHSGQAAPEDQPVLARQAMPASARLSLLDTYYQRLVQAGQYEIARKAFVTIREAAQEGSEPEVQAYLGNRIEQLDMIGRPAPAFEGRDVDGRPVRLQDYAGKPVLLVFWATWYRPNAEQVAWMKRAYAPYRDRGLEVIGVNLDAMVEQGRPAEQVVPDVRRYILEYNIPWPNIINAPGQGDISAAYGVTEIPANVLIDRDGHIAALEVTEANFAREVERVLGGSR